ncbi:hypothetical protein SHKM778_72500 [Streptomyces sp. KM77-8]|uniref:Uncharacterized protein n=1 Tax=Streptomyces haneummycinicus TaxID=3074435 RepID=A0AAT9HU51_9ACTN
MVGIGFYPSPPPCPAKDTRAPPSTEEGGDMTTDPNAIQPSELDQLPDRDPEETAEWQASLDAVTKAAGPHRAAYLMRRTLERAEEPA